MKTSLPKAFSLGVLMNLLIPGAGHVYFREYLFGLFIFLITLIAAILFFVSYLVPLPATVKWLLFILPIIFYFFTFFDLYRSVKKQLGTFKLTRLKLSIFIIVGILYQVLVPIAPGNFILNNFPDIYQLSDNHLSPLYRKSDLLEASRLAYSIKIAGYGKRLYHSFPERFDMVRFKQENGATKTGMVIGLPLEQVEVADGVIVINGYPLPELSPRGLNFLGDWPLTVPNRYSILVATFNLGQLDRVYEVSLQDVIGKVSKLF